jgi:hypothetical protein
MLAQDRGKAGADGGIAGLRNKWTDKAALWPRPAAARGGERPGATEQFLE